MITIRPYESKDSHAVWELHNLALQNTGAHLGNGPWDDDLGNIPQVYQQNRGVFLVGVFDNQIVAMGAVKHTDATRAEIKRMRVHPDFQCRGFGAVLLNALEVEARRLGYQVLQLDTTTLQKAAQKLYEKHGYRKIGRTQLRGLETLLYEKELTKSTQPVQPTPTRSDAGGRG
jgi:ribosomal protein S18 acetylase RimI-like enzyme